MKVSIDLFRDKPTNICREGSKMSLSAEDRRQDSQKQFGRTQTKQSNRTSPHQQPAVLIQAMQKVSRYGCLTSKTSSSRILVPNTVMPSVLMTAWSLLASGLVTFFLQSTMMVTLFFSTLSATRCHLCGKQGQLLRNAAGSFKFAWSLRLVLLSG